MCFGLGCPFECSWYGEHMGECCAPKGAPCPSNYEDQGQWEYVFDAWERGDSVEQAAEEWKELEAQRKLEEEEDDEEA